MIRQKVLSQLSDYGHESLVYDIAIGCNATTLAQEAVAAGAEIVIAAGGDGTVNGIAKGVNNTNVALFHLPLGSGNGFARTMGIPLKIDAALALLRNPVIRKVDTATMNGELFVISCGFGLDAQIAHDFSKLKIRGIGPYILFGFKRYFRYVSERYRLTDLDTNRTWEAEALIVAATLSPQFGGGAIVAPMAAPDDGYLDWFEGENPNLHEVPRIYYRLFNGSLDVEKRMHYYRVKRIQVERLSDRREIHLDGEACYSEKVNVIEIHPLTLSAVVGPAHFDGWK